MKSASELPEPPVNVVVEMIDGTKAPAECYWGGYNDAGSARWITVGVYPGARSVSVDLLPARTELVVRTGDLWDDVELHRE